MPLNLFFLQRLPRAATTLAAAFFVASCATTLGPAQHPARSPAVATDVSVERVILQAFRAIGDRHYLQPDFRQISVEAYHGFSATDPSLSLTAGDQVFRVNREGREVLSRPTPADPADGRAWGGMLAELLAASIKASPVLQQTDRNTLTKAAMTATTKLLDKSSRYADPEEARDNRFQRDGGGGIGITIERTDDKRVMIRSVQSDAPAGKGGVQTGDQVMAIDGENVADKPLNEVVSRLRGTVGTPVALGVLRQAKEITFALKRSRIVPTSVVYERRGDVAVIRLTSFNSATDDVLHQTIDKARAEIGRDIAGLVIDMRSNRGGLLDQAQAVAEEFIGDGVIFSTQGRHADSQRVYRSSSRRTLTLPMVVLINGNSASSAEIVAAALQDRGRAVIVGSTSYGKGTVQTVVRLANEGELVLTWSRLVAPSGYSWNELGVLPNICTAKVLDAATMGIEAVESTRAALARWHAERNPSPADVVRMREVCPPGEDTPERDLEIATRLLRDPNLYAQVVRSGTVNQAARP